MKQMSLVMLVLLIGAIAGYCGTAQTNEVKSAFQAADANRDGKITPDEFKQHAKQATFENTDRDGDKKIDAQEWKAADTSQQNERNFATVDKDRDATVNFLEFSDAVDRGKNYDDTFQELDRNRDGSLAPDEYNSRQAFNIMSIKF